MLSAAPAALQERGAGLPASDLQSQLNDMLDDSASDGSSTLQGRGGMPTPLRPTPNLFTPALQARGGSPNPAAQNAGLQQMLAGSNDEEENDMGDMQMLGQQSGFDQQQITDMSSQLQVRILLLAFVYVHISHPVFETA